MSAPSDLRCPICGKPLAQGDAARRFIPFCSGRCADLDLGRWLKGGYAIPGAPEEAENPGSGPGPAPGQAPDEE